MILALGNRVDSPLVPRHRAEGYAPRDAVERGFVAQRPPYRGAPPWRGVSALWQLAVERGMIQADGAIAWLEEVERWIRLWDESDIDTAALDADPAVVTWERVPEDSPALKVYLAGGHPQRRLHPEAPPRDAWAMFSIAAVHGGEILPEVLRAFPS